MQNAQERWYGKTLEELFSSLDTTAQGIISQEAAKRLHHYGRNDIKEQKKDSIASIFLRQLKSFVLWVLIAAGTISFFLHEVLETMVIAIIILFVILINFIMDYKASRDLEALLRLTPQQSTVLRNNQKLSILSSELVPGDVLVLTRGDIVGADARVIEAHNLKVDESSLTGESEPVTKSLGELHGTLSLSQQANMLFAGTHITNGHAMAVVVRTGEETEFGKISKLLKNIEHEATPLQRRLDKLTRQLSIFAIFLAITVFIVGLLHGNNWATMLIFSLAALVSGIPESLPTVVAVTLAAGVRKMANRNAIVKHLPAVETLGTCTVICTDKTGTLTQNKMVIENIFTTDAEVVVTGEGYKPDGMFLVEDVKVDAKKHKTLSRMLEIGVLCNNADIKKEKDEWVVDGEATEGALVVLARKAGIVKLEYHKQYPRKKEHPFDPDRKCMSVVHLYKGKHFVYSKGAPELLLRKAKYYLHHGELKRLDKQTMGKYLEKNREYASKGLRVLGLAFKEHKGSLALEHVESGLVFVGLVSIRDPPEPTAKASVKRCKDAGIKVVMITGDNEVTAKAVAAELGIYTAKDMALTGTELDQLTDTALDKIIDKVTVYARVTPTHKLRIVERLQKDGHIVAMTGDGVNDAPALKKADIGIAMGRRGTDVAKESAELILKDDNFTTIANAVEDGRTIYENIRKFIYFLLVGNFSEVLIVFIAVLVGASLPLTALMILFINLVTGELPALGLSFEKPSDRIMKQRPRDPKEGILSDYLLLRSADLLPLIVLGTLTLYMSQLVLKGVTLPKAQTIAFATIIFFEIFHAYNARSWDESLFSRKFFSNKYILVGTSLVAAATITVIHWEPLQKIFGTASLTLSEWGLILLVSSSVILFIELKKTFLQAELKERQKMDIYPSRERAV